MKTMKIDQNLVNSIVAALSASGQAGIAPVAKHANGLKSTSIKLNLGTVELPRLGDSTGGRTKFGTKNAKGQKYTVNGADGKPYEVYVTAYAK